MSTPRIVTVTVNPALDYSYTVPSFVPGAVYRSSRSRVTPGGKGINVARVLHTLGAEVVATGYIGGSNGDTILRGLNEEGITHDFVRIDPLQNRQAILILDPATREQTVINEVGPAATEDLKDQLRLKLGSLMADAEFVVFSGSLLPGSGTGSYASLISAARAAGVRSVLDTSGDALKAGVMSHPNVVKVNRDEAAYLGVKIDDWARDAGAAAEKLRQVCGASCAVITGGSRGSAMAGEKGIFLAKELVLDVVSAVGSGDSFAAGLVYSLATKPGDLESALRLASACGAANTLSEGAGFCTLDQIREISGKITLDRMG